MILLVQNVTSASLSIDGKVFSQIEKGYVVLVSFTNDDTIEIASKMADKLINMRVFSDAEGKTNLSIQDVNGDILSVSQFTLYGKFEGRRPSFTSCMRGEFSKPLYEAFNNFLKERFKEPKTGVFGADMKINLVNDGPSTWLLDSKELIK